MSLLVQLPDAIAMVPQREPGKVSQVVEPSRQGPLPKLVVHELATRVSSRDQIQVITMSEHTR